jgi:hypothetical protein
MKSEAFIEVTQHEVGHRHYRTYKWVGKPSDPVHISCIDDNMNELPWPLEKVYEDSWYGAWYIRTDVRFWWWTWLRYHLQTVWQWIEVRLILTLHVWGLAYNDPCMYITWKDVMNDRTPLRIWWRKVWKQWTSKS